MTPQGGGSTGCNISSFCRTLLLSSLLVRLGRHGPCASRNTSILCGPFSFFCCREGHLRGCCRQSFSPFLLSASGDCIMPLPLSSSIPKRSFTLTAWSQAALPPC